VRLFRRKDGEGGQRVAEVYVGLRNQILGLTADDLGDALEPDTRVIAVLMETGYEKAVATLVGVADGSTSLYFSTGGGIIGAGDHTAVAEATQRWLFVCAGVLESFESVADPTLPSEGMTQFVVVTRDGLLGAAGREDELVNYAHTLAPLFHAGQDVITQVRLTEEG
jgi:hypothetical protein